ncbi:hypothetical protein MPSEU_000765500 [Mayamaea pseudoterrestris]|nr:hypothetical protein MPSEU_000765500 [Mayamaea pseudoterrestris]
MASIGGWCVLHPDLQSKLDNELVLSAAHNGFTLSPPPFRFRCNVWHYTNGPVLAEKTQITSYLSYYSMLWRFLAMIGDWESMLVLLLPRPIGLGKVPSMKVESLVLFLRWKKLDTNTFLRDDDEMLLRDANFNEPIRCNGGWKSNHSMKAFASAIVWLHMSIGYEAQDSFKEKCVDCLNLFRVDQNSHGCNEHFGNRQIKRIGQPTHCFKFANGKKQLLDKDYEVHGSCAIAPWQLRKLGALLVYEGLVGLSVWVAVLIAINLYLRADDELLTISMESFEASSFHVEANGRINGVCLKIRGKTDSRGQYFHLWADHEYPDICPVRHLLLLVHLLGLKKGWLFQSLRSLGANTRRDDGDYRGTKRLDYGTIFKYLKERFIELFGPETGKGFGMHSFRKGAYLKAAFQKADLRICQYDARHMRHEEAVLYLGNANTLVSSNEINPSPGNELAKAYRGVHNGGAQPSPQEHAGKSLAQLADEFVLQLKVPHGVARNVRSLVIEAQQFQWSTVEGDCLEQWLMTVPVELRNPCKTICLRYKRHVESIYKQQQLIEAEKVAAVTPPSSSSSSKRAKNATPPTNFFAGRETIAQLKSLPQKLDALLELHDRVEAIGGVERIVLDAKEKKYFARTLAPVARCFKKHCGEDRDAFVGRWERTFAIKFSESCCKGVGECGR